METNRWQVVLCASALFVLSGCAARPTVTQAVQPTGASAVSPIAPEPQGDAKAILMRMARFLSQTQRFSVNIRSGYEVLQGTGEKIEFGEVRTLTVRRPHAMRIESEQSDGGKRLVLFDGKQITVFSTPQNVYATVYKPGTIDQAVAYFIRDLHMRLPLAMLFVNQLPAELDRRLQAIKYVEKTNMHGIPTHHLAGRTETVDFQVWVGEGDRPLPLRVILTYKGEDGQPQFRAQLTDWNLVPEITDSMFAFAPPQAARKIAFLPQVARIAAQRTQAPQQTGGRK